MRLAVVGGRLFRAGRFEEGDLLIEGERIAAVGRRGEFAGARTIDAKGCAVLPGLLDVHVHFREPGLERKEGWAHGSRGALHGGATAVLEIQNNPPLTTSLDLLLERERVVEASSRVDFGLFPNLMETSVDALRAMGPRVPGFKLFMGGSTGVGGVTDYGLMRDLFRGARDAGRPVVVHAEEESILRRNASRMPKATAREHHLVRSEEAETVSIAAAIELAAATGASLHVFHVSTRRGAELLAQARASGLDVHGSTCPHYLLLTHEDSASLGNLLKVNPSVKEARDRDGLCERVADGTIAAIGTDHAPHPMEEKQLPYAQAPSGLPSVDLLLPLLLEIARRGVPLGRLLDSATRDAARCFAVEGKGQLEIGFDADVVIVDLEEAREVRGAELPSRSRWTPFEGRTLHGFPRVVLRRGRVALDRGAEGELPPARRLRFAPPSAP